MVWSGHTVKAWNKASGRGGSIIVRTPVLDYIVSELQSIPLTQDKVDDCVLGNPPFCARRSATSRKAGWELQLLFRSPGHSFYLQTASTKQEPLAGESVLSSYNANSQDYSSWDRLLFTLPSLTKKDRMGAWLSQPITLLGSTSPQA
jgi:hypothetical protein